MNKNDILEFRIQNKLNELREQYNNLLDYMIQMEEESGIEDINLRDRLYDIKTKMFLLQDILEGK